MINYIINHIRYLKQDKVISEEVRKLIEELIQSNQSVPQFIPITDMDIFKTPVIYFSFTILNEATIYLYQNRVFICSASYFYAERNNAFYLKDNSLYNKIKKQIKGANNSRFFCYMVWTMPNVRTSFRKNCK
jgi:hypothetical protein